MASRATFLLLALGLLAGCRDGETTTPTVSQVLPTAVPAYAAAELSILGAGFFPVMGVSTLSGQAVVGSESFSVRLVPTAGLDATCAPTELELQDVEWRGAGELRGRVPSESCAGEYQVQVVDPRGVTSALGPSVTLSPVWPDHLAVLPGACAAAPETAPEEVVATLQTEAAFSIRVVGPNDEPASAFPPALRTADQLAARVSLSVSAEDDLVAASLVTSSLDAASPKAGEALRLEGNLNTEGCGDLVLMGTSPGRLRLVGASQALPVQGDPGSASLDVLFQPAGSLVLAIGVPTSVTVGVPFDVTIEVRNSDSGEQVETADACVDLRANTQPVNIVSTPNASFSCGSGLQPMSHGRWVGQVEVEDSVPQAFLIASTQHGVFGASEWFAIEAGRAAQVKVAGPGRVVAGEPFDLMATVTDTFDNPVDLQPAALQAPTDITGTLSCAAGPEIVDGEASWSGCTITGVAPTNVISVRYGLDLVGRTPSFPTVAGGPASLELTVPDGSQVAGESFDVTLTVLDAWGNVATGSSGDARFSLQTSAALYVSSAHVTGGVLDARVEAYIAGQDALQVSYSELSASQALTIVAGGMDGFRVGRTGSGDVVAGDAVPLQVTALDAYDNTIKDFQAVGGLTVTDSAGVPLIEAEPVTFVNGAVSVAPVVEVARQPEMLSVTDGQGHTGSIGGIIVIPGEIDGFEILRDETAYFAAEAFDVELHAVDAFGNLITDFTGQVYYSDTSLTLSPSSGGAFEGGVRRESFTIAVPFPDDVLKVSAQRPDGSGISSSTGRFPVLDDCEAGMDVVLSLPNINSPERGTMCLIKPVGGTNVDAIATVRGNQSQGIKYVWSDGQEFQTTLLDTHTFSVGSPGYYPVSVTAYEVSSLCGARDAFDLWAGKPSSPTGPLTMVADKEVLSAGSANGSERAGIHVTALDCQGEAAKDKTELTLLTSYGAIRGVVDTAPARPGIQVNMVQGAFDLTLSVGEEQQATTATVVAGTADGSCFGSLEVPVVNDTLSPWVVDFGPSGRTTGLVPTAWVRFSQEMLPESLLLNDFLTLDVNDGVTSRQLVHGEDYSLVMDAEAEVLTITFLPEGLGLDVSGSTVVVTLPSEDGGFNVEGANNKRLDGNWDGVSDPDDRFTFQFGAVNDVKRPTVRSCLPNPIVYTPAAYDSSDGEAAGIHISGDLADDLSLKSWRLEVYDLFGTSLYEKYGIVAAQPEVGADVIWYGRSMDGPVVPNGTYWYEVSAIDVAGNVSDKVCQGWVEIANPLDLASK